jgi:hypothetical protein
LGARGFNVKRSPEPNLPLTRASLPEGCSDLVEAYKMRAESKEERERLMLRIAALLHDRFVDQLEPEVLIVCDEGLLRQRISDFLHPILLAYPKFEELIGESSELVEMLFDVVMANADEGER